jgi:hypothetical protein
MEAFFEGRDWFGCSAVAAALVGDGFWGGCVRVVLPGSRPESAERDLGLPSQPGPVRINRKKRPSVGRRDEVNLLIPFRILVGLFPENGEIEKSHQAGI